MKNEQESKEKVQRSRSSTSVVVETIDLTIYATTSTEPSILLAKSSELQTTPPATESQNAVEHTTVDIGETVLGEAVQKPTTSGLYFLGTHSEERNAHRLANSEPNMSSTRANFQVMRTVAGGLINSNNLMHHEDCLKEPNSKISTGRTPPSYSTVLKLGPPITHFDSRTYSSIPFITRQPPPSYAEVHGEWDDNIDNPSMISADSFALGPHPLYISCPRCRTIVVSDIHTERSHLSYVVSLVLCVFMCWPCCLLPFCLKSFRNTYHFCPTCHFYLGVYRPC